MVHHLIHWGEIVRAYSDGELSAHQALHLLDMCELQRLSGVRAIGQFEKADSIGIQWRSFMCEGGPLYGCCKTYFPTN
jgi:hypothetical protein